jgi:hypothetical protein
MHRMNRESEVKCNGIPYLAKNERDVGHPAFVEEARAEMRLAAERSQLLDHRRPAFAYVGRLLERVTQLQHSPIVVMAAHDLHANRQTA